MTSHRRIAWRVEQQRPIAFGIELVDQLPERDIEKHFVWRVPIISRIEERMGYGEGGMFWNLGIHVFGK